MRLTFPNGEHPDVVEQGRITLGSGADSLVRLPGLADRHAVIANDRRGLWLVIESSEATAHVNARPVSRLALVRPGDLISLGQVQVLLRCDNDPVAPKLPPAADALSRQSAGSGAVGTERFALRGVGGAHYGQSFPLTDPVIVGRGDSASLRLDDPSLSDRHARIEVNGDRVVLRDLGNGQGEGTMLNGVRVHNALLAHGDQLAWDQNRYVLEAPGLSAPVQRHDTTPLPRTKASSQDPSAQAMRSVTGVFSAPALGDGASGSASQAPAAAAPASAIRKGLTVWWLIAAAALIGAALAWLLIYGAKISG